MITYNHEAYVAAAIEGVLMQQCGFDYEFIIGEDCSTDGTRGVVEAYARLHPQRIRLITSETNVGAQRNFARVFAACTGQYVALLDGDDYWTSPQKLQRQVDYLETHRDCALCFHNVQFADESGTSHPPALLNRPDQPERSVLGDLLREGNFIATSSVMYRWESVTTLPNWWNDVWIGDWPLHVLHAEHGYIGYINEVMGAYRVHAGGLWSSSRLADQVAHEALIAQLLGDHVGPEYQRAVHQRIFAIRESGARRLLEAGHRELARDHALWCVAHLPWKGDVPLARVARLAVLTVAPRLMPLLVGTEHLVRSLRGRISRAKPRGLRWRNRA